MPAGQRIKRFYKTVDVVEHPDNDLEENKLSKDQPVDFTNLSQSDKYWAVTLDGKVTKTMYKDPLLIPSKALAVALAEEWEKQHESVNLKDLVLVSLCA
jgi:chaperone required for assembly of F1-ATPase